jgi:hypothetical protein
MKVLSPPKDSKVMRPLRVVKPPANPVAQKLCDALEEKARFT